MLESLREAFHQALENFYTELNRDRVPEAADRLLRAMKAELIALRSRTSELEAELEATADEARREHEATKTCLRREELAQKIGDDDTASVAREFAGKHLRRHEILTEKATVLSKEIEEQKRSLDEMTDQFRDARLRRESLAATIGRADTSERLRQTSDLFEEMDRMAEKIEDMEAQAEAAREIDETFSEGESSSARSPDDLDARLEALKRRMQEG